MARATNEPSNYFAVAKQQARDSATLGAFFFYKYLDGTGLENDPNTESVREGGDGQEVGLRYRTRITMDGQVVTNSRPGAVGRALVWALGQEVGGPSIVATSAGGNIIARVAAPAATLPYLTVEQQYGDEIERAINCKFANLVIEGEAGKVIKITNQIMSGGSVIQRDVASSLTPVVETTRPHFFPFASLSLDGAGNSTVTKFKVEAARNIDGDVQTTAITRDDLVETNADYNLDLTLKYVDRTIYNKIQFSGGSTVPVDLATGSFDLFLPNGSFPLRLNMPLIDYADAKVNKLDPDGKTVYIDVTAMTHKNASYALWALILSPDATSYLLP